MDGFKKNPDSTQLLDFYNKLISDHPLIEFLETPFYSKENDSFIKFYTKLQNQKPNEHLSSKIIISDIIHTEKNLENQPLVNNNKLVFTNSDIQKDSKIMKTEELKNIKKMMELYTNWDILVLN